jgi:hypothetical protein
MKTKIYCETEGTNNKSKKKISGAVQNVLSLGLDFCLINVPGRNIYNMTECLKLTNVRVANNGKKKLSCPPQAAD